MSRFYSREAISIASVFCISACMTACNDPTSGYFQPIQESQPAAGPGSSASPVASSSPVSPGGASSGGTTSTCSPQMAQNLRIMLIVDASGSTKSDDAGAKIRMGSVRNFINANLMNNNLSYSFTYFVASPQDPTYDFSSSMFSTNASVTFGNANQALGAVNLFQNTFNTIGGGGTDYQYALQSAAALISSDNTANPGKYSYAIVFMSDGEPNVGPDTSSTLDPLVTDLINVVGPARTTLSAVYFSNKPIANDESIIDKMAIAGNGQYVNGDTSNLNLNTMIQGILSVPSGACAPGSSS